MKKTQIVGPTLPSAAYEDSPSSSPTSVSQTLPRNPQHHPEGVRPQDSSHVPSSSSDSDSSSDSGFGPVLPSQATAAMKACQAHGITPGQTPWEEEQKAIKPQKAERDAWMTMPPTQDDLSARFDPTKLRARKFNTGRGAAAIGGSSGGGGASTLWTETPEQKRKRLADEVMGVETKDERNRKRTMPGPGNKSGASRREEKEAAQSREIAKRIKDHTEKTRGPSLYASHQAQTRKGGKKEEEDDPSARPFNREKDIASGAQVGYIQRREMVGRAADFGSKFSGGNYL